MQASLGFLPMISTILSYVFTVIIYMFIFSVIRLVYLDVKKMSRFEENSANDSACASLKPVKSRVEIEHPLKKRYNIYDEAIIGRGKSCDIIIPETFISSRHVHIWFEDGEWYLEDLGSRNGTTVNGQRIKTVVMLDPEDEISLGGINFLFEM